MRTIAAITVQLTKTDFTRWCFEKAALLREVATELSAMRNLIACAKITLLDGDTHRTLGTFVFENGTLEPYDAPTLPYERSRSYPHEFPRGT